MSGWFYGLVRETNGKIRLHEIVDEGKYLWSHRAITTWALKELFMVIKDLYDQWRYYNQLWDGEVLDKNLDHQIKKFNKEAKKAIKDNKLWEVK